MADGYGGVGVQQQLGNGEADYVAAAQHHGVFAADLHAGLLEQAHHARGSAGHAEVALLAVGPELSHVERVEAVDVLLMGDGGDYLVLGDVLGQGKLHQYAVHGRIIVELVYAGEQLLFGRFGRKQDREVLYARFLAGYGLVAHVSGAGLVVPDEDYRQFGRPAVFLWKLSNLPGKGGLDGIG